MKVKLGFVLLLMFAFALNAYAQETTSAAEQVDKLKAQLLEVQGKEECLRTRLQ